MRSFRGRRRERLPWQGRLILGCLLLLALQVGAALVDLYTPDRALCRDCAAACRTSTGFMIICVPPERRHACPACGKEWWGSKDFACLHGDRVDGCAPP